MHFPSIAKNYLVQFISRVAAVTLGLLALAVMTRALGDSGFGEYTTAVTYLQIVAVFVDLGLTLMFIQMISEPGADEPRLSSAFLGLRLLSNAVIFALAASAAFATPYPTTIKLAIAVGSIGYLSLSTTGMLTGFFQKHLAMWRAAGAEMVNRVLTLILIIWAAKMGWGVVPMVGIFALSNTVQMILLIFLAQPFTRMRPKVDIPVWKEAVRRSWPIGLGIFFNLLYLRSDILILGLYAPQSEVGIYGAAYRVLDVFTALPVMYMGLVLPHLVATWAKGHKDAFHRILQQTFDAFSLTVLPLLFGTPIVAIPLMILIAGGPFGRSGFILPILMLAMLPIFTGAMTGHAIVALNKQRAMLPGYILTAVVALVGYFVLIPSYGIYGAAWMTVASEVLINTLTAIVVIRTSGWRPKFGLFSKALLSSALMFAVLTALPDGPVLLSILLGAVVYVAALFGLRAVSIHSLKTLLHPETP